MPPGASSGLSATLLAAVSVNLGQSKRRPGKTIALYHFCFKINEQDYRSKLRYLSGYQMKQTAGTLLYRTSKGKVEVLLVHPSGNYNKKAHWSIPKGLPEESESLEQAARRETCEETGVVPGELEVLGYVDYTKSRKRVHCFFGPAPANADPQCTSWEVDQSVFVPIEKALKLIHPDQSELLTRLMSLIG